MNQAELPQVKADEELIEVWPVNQSMSGKNAYYHFCENENAYRGYAVCLHTIVAAEEDRLKATDCVNCQRAISGGYCPANKMRAEEREAGEALYYIPRRNINPANTRSEKEAQADALKISSSGKYDLNNASYARGWAMVGAKQGDPDDQKKLKAMQASRPASAPAPKKKSGFVEESFADVVNAIQKDEKPAASAAPKSTPAPTLSIKPMPGETPVEFARRRAALLKSQQS